MRRVGLFTERQLDASLAVVRAPFGEHIEVLPVGKRIAVRNVVLALHDGQRNRLRLGVCIAVDLLGLLFLCKRHYRFHIFVVGAFARREVEKAVHRKGRILRTDRLGRQRVEFRFRLRLEQQPVCRQHGDRHGHRTHRRNDAFEHRRVFVFHPFSLLFGKYRV